VVEVHELALNLSIEGLGRGDVAAADRHATEAEGMETTIPPFLCILGQVRTAQGFLMMPSAALCRTTFAEDDGGDPEETAATLAGELAPILAQQGAVRQRQGRSAEAIALYQAALQGEYVVHRPGAGAPPPPPPHPPPPPPPTHTHTRKSSAHHLPFLPMTLPRGSRCCVGRCEVGVRRPDAATLVTAHTNLASLAGRDVFAAAKRLRHVTAEAVLARATPVQRRAVAVNEAIVRFHMSKVSPRLRPSPS
jgi:hypothetical protein